MKPSILKFSLILALSAAALAGCGKNEKKTEATVPPAAAPVAATAPASLPAAAPASTPTGDVKADARAMRLACADDIRKFCSGAEKAGKCLKEHKTQLSAACADARRTLREARKADKGDQAD